MLQLFGIEIVDVAVGCVVLPSLPVCPLSGVWGEQQGCVVRCGGPCGLLTMTMEEEMRRWEVSWCN